MSGDFLKTYTLSIKTITPIHVGMGDKLHQGLDFITENGNLIVIDQSRLMKWIARQPNAEKLARQLEDSLSKGEKGIAEFLRAEPMRSDLKLLDKIQAYTVPYTGRPREVLAFIKDDHHNPYLPGSSLKGALRSAILRGAMVNDTDFRNWARDLILTGIRQKNTFSNRIDANLFSSNAPNDSKTPNYDVNRLLVIRDSSPIPWNNLSIARVKVLSVHNRTGLRWKKKPYGAMEDMEIYAEVLTTERVDLQVVLQTNLLSQFAHQLKFKGSESIIAFLPEFCRITAQNLLEQEYDFYKRHGHSSLAKWCAGHLEKLNHLPENVFYLLLGWGTGYDAKTITDLLGESTFKEVIDTFRNTQGLGKPGNNKYAPWLGIADSPKSRKVVVQGDSLLPLGWLEVRLESLDGEDWLSKERQHLAAQKPKQTLGQVIKEVREVSSAQRAPEKSPSPREKPAEVAQKPLIPKFSQLPQVGDRFEGMVFDTDERRILLEIPGLDPDEKAYALLSFEQIPIMTKAKVGQTIRCEVISLEKEQEQYWCVICRLA